jgi:hypothetical protein
VAYARLSGDPVTIDQEWLEKEGKAVTWFHLGEWLSGKSILFKIRFAGRVRKQFTTLLTSPVHRILPLEQVADGIDIYRSRMSAGKVILRPGLHE